MQLCINLSIPIRLQTIKYAQTRHRSCYIHAYISLEIYARCIQICTEALIYLKILKMQQSVIDIFYIGVIQLWNGNSFNKAKFQNVPFTWIVDRQQQSRTDCLKVSMLQQIEFFPGHKRIHFTYQLNASIIRLISYSWSANSGLNFKGEVNRVKTLKPV